MSSFAYWKLRVFDIPETVVRETRGAAAFFVALLVAAVGAAQATEGGPITYRCEYRTYSDERGGPHKQSTGPFRLTFLVDSGKAYHVGPLGAEPVRIVQNAHGGLTFIEITQTGNVMTTVLSANGDSVHSRASNLHGELVPSQHYGRCAGPT